MKLIPHSTRCPACGRLLYATDDRFAVRLTQGEKEVPGAPPGLYHYGCFLRLPGRDEHLKRNEVTTGRVLDQQSEFFTVLARTAAFALAFRPAVDTFVLYFIAHGRLMEFRGLPAWRLFLAHLAGPDAPRPTASGSANPVRVKRNADGWEVAVRQFAPIEADVSPADLAKLRGHLDGRGVDPSRTPVELGAVGGRLGVSFPRASCPPERLTGTFAWPDAAPGPGGVVTITVQVEVWYAVDLTDRVMTALRDFLRQLNRPAG